MDESCNDVCRACVGNHSQNGLNYEWLNVLGHGKLVNVWFEEPVGSKNYRLYTDEWWETHCSAVDHSEDLYKSHMEAFVYPNTRFARLLFLFEDKTLMEPTSQFYILEEEYFKRNVLKTSSVRPEPIPLPPNQSLSWRQLSEGGYTTTNISESITGGDRFADEDMDIDTREELKERSVARMTDIEPMKPARRPWQSGPGQNYGAWTLPADEGRRSARVERFDNPSKEQAPPPPSRYQPTSQGIGEWTRQGTKQRMMGSAQSVPRQEWDDAINRPSTQPSQYRQGVGERLPGSAQPFTQTERNTFQTQPSQAQGWGSRGDAGNVQQTTTQIGQQAQGAERIQPSLSNPNQATRPLTQPSVSTQNNPGAQYYRGQGSRGSVSDTLTQPSTQSNVQQAQSAANPLSGWSSTNQGTQLASTQGWGNRGSSNVQQTLAQTGQQTQGTNRLPAVMGRGQSRLNTQPSQGPI